MQILESARLAPSGNNMQPWKFIIVRNNETKEKLTAQDHNQRWMMTAPVFLVCVADLACRIDPESVQRIDENSALPEVKMIIRDTAVAIEHILLEAENQGLATCWTGWYEQDKIRPILHIPEDKYVCGIVTLGYGDECVAARPRKALDELLMYEEWDKKEGNTEGFRR